MSRIGIVWFEGEKTRDEILECLEAWFPDAKNFKFEYRGEEVCVRLECSQFDVLQHGEVIPSYIPFFDYYDPKKLVQMTKVTRSEAYG